MLMLVKSIAIFLLPTSTLIQKIWGR